MTELEEMCKLCHEITNHNDFQVIGDITKEILDFLLMKINFSSSDRGVICQSCCKKYLAAFHFKSTCLYTEDIIFPYADCGNAIQIDLKDIFIKEAKNQQLKSILVRRKLCRFCLQPVANSKCISMCDVDGVMMKKFLPEINTSIIKDPILCLRCFDSLKIHTGFLKKFEALNTDIRDSMVRNRLYVLLEPYIHEEISKKNVSEEVLLESRSSDAIIEKRNNDIRIANAVLKPATCTNDGRDVPKIHKDVADVQTYKCHKCKYESRRKRYLKIHQLVHKDPSEVEMYKCYQCKFETKRKRCLKKHQLVHKDPSEVPMYKCCVCEYATKHKRCLNEHQLLHKSPSEVRMYPCGKCTFKTPYRRTLAVHELRHKDPSEVPMHKCDECSFQTKHKHYLKHHILVHRNDSEVPMYKCDKCQYVTKRMRYLNIHRFVHHDPSEVEVYRCDKCEYQTKIKRYLTKHFLRNKHLNVQL